MKKLTSLALVAMLAFAGAAFAGERFAGIEANATFGAGSPATTNNDDSCDISVAPAATLLLPYFEVDIANTAGTGQTTLFAITNVSPAPQIAHVTIWTDYSIPVLDFNIFLTGYDVQTINLYDVIARGVVAPDNGTSSRTSIGSRSFQNNAAYVAGLGGGLTLTDCTALPGQLPEFLRAEVATALTTGAYPTLCGTTRVGGTHANAIGYVTIDVINQCSTSLPDNADYFEDEIRFENVLVGDFQQVNGNATAGNFAQGNPMVHLRAIPEIGAAATTDTNLPYTFYDRYTQGSTAVAGRQVDRRQPLPARFAARWIAGGATGFQTYMKIWREGLALPAAGAGIECDTDGNVAIPLTEIVRFDERENPFVGGGGVICSPICGPAAVTLPETSRTAVNVSSVFPQVTNGAVGGWMYMNLDNGGTAGYTGGVNRPSQNWVVVSMQADGRFSTDFDAAWLGNGCSPSVAAGAQIEPSVNVTPAAF